MTVRDATSTERLTRPLVVEVRRGRGFPPRFFRNWRPLWDTKVDMIEINRNAASSRAVIWWPQLRWDTWRTPVFLGDMIRIRTDDVAGTPSVVFQGFITQFLNSFSGGDERGGSYERCAAAASDYRWLLGVTSPIFGQVARGPDDYDGYGAGHETPKIGEATIITGKRAIFNADGKPNRDPDDLLMPEGGGYAEIPIFIDPDIAEYWTARDMLRHVLSKYYNAIYDELPIPDPAALPGVDHSDWDTVLNHIVVDGLNITEAIDLICTHLGWGWREDYFIDSPPLFCFYKTATANGYTRNNTHDIILHNLYAPAVDEDIRAAVSGGEKMLWAMEYTQDIRDVVNNPWGIGAPDRFEFTAELVPAWNDDDLVPDTSDDNSHLYLTEAALQDVADPNSIPYYNLYHARGANFKSDVGRKWALNESGTYSYDPYDRGMPFDFTKVIPAEYILDEDGKRAYAPFNRRLLPCLTRDKDGHNSVGIKVEFSFDGGQNWQVIPCAISSTPNEAGIHITEANLAELVDERESSFAGGPLDGIQLNFWTSLCEDKLAGASFADGEWQTRIRVTASVQMDQRLRSSSEASGTSGSVFVQSDIYDFSERYSIAVRSPQSTFSDNNTALPAAECNDWAYMAAHLDAIRAANQNMSISGRFVLERLWLGDGSGFPDFAVGDCIEGIKGRVFQLPAAFGDDTVFPEIIRIIYLPERQRMTLITRDFRYAEVSQ